ncbi:hypothetical protein LTS08_003659 [Lithohypha guttulata]|uniref:N-acetyltransferase domain-containing protein n=1 Tax=Lithohypha guttulata TaxID=1690604 RepID=A0AAN7SWE2_9EURO|nr:hypothetical protein LTR51_001386 [Lithohypha guttulata]KAK5083466.1 hypothetical protein LTR05_005968 [Lithohypha guttulata]KAK5102857.1 hypothetical protein LTS08_003659 [Lithohypha guttulata]
MAAASILAPALDSTIVIEKRSSTADRIAADPRSNSIRVVAPYEYKEAAKCLAEAFKDDHVVRYAIDTPDRAHWSEEEKYALHLQAMEYVTYAHCLKGLVTTVGPDYDCVALWMPPGKNIDDLLTILRSGMWRLNWQLSKEGRTRFFKEFLPLLASTKTEVLGERDNHAWYLNYIGTKAGSRGNGYARRLIEHVGDVADRAGQACYLESSHDINIKIYGKMGFTLRKQIWLGLDETIRMDVMVREPKGVLKEKI